MKFFCVINEQNLLYKYTNSFFLSFYFAWHTQDILEMEIKPYLELLRMMEFLYCASQDRVLYFVM